MLGYHRSCLFADKGACAGQIWFDGGYDATQQDKIESLLAADQPQAVIFNGCDVNGTCLSANSSECKSVWFS